MTTPTEELNDPIDIMAHLFFASGTADNVRLVTPTGTYEGVFRFPEDDAAWVLFSAGMPSLPPGTPVAVEYTGPDDEYRFHTTAAGTRSNAMRLGMPTAIERTDRRLTRRLTLPEHWSIRFEEATPTGARSFLLDDLSDGGAGLLDPDNAVTTIGQRIAGAIHLPNRAPLPAVLEARHIETRGAGRRIGARLIGITPEARATLSTFLRAAQQQIAETG